MSAVSQVYSTLAQSNTTLDAPLLRAVFTWAKSHKEESLLLDLLRRRDLPSDVLQGFSRITSARVRSLYLSRPEVSTEERSAAVAKEKRVTVLAAIASSADASDELLDAVSRHEGKAVALALLTRSSCPTPVKERAFRTLTQYVENLSWDESKTFSTVLAALPTLHDELATTSSSERVLAGVLTSQSVTLAGRRRLLQKLVVEALTPYLPHLSASSGSSPGYRHWEAERVLTTCAERSASLLSVPGVEPEIVSSVVEFFAPLSLPGRARVQLDEALALHGEGQSESATRLSQARTSSNPEQLADLATWCLSQPKTPYHYGANPEIAALASTLVANSALPDDSALSLIRLVDSTLMVKILTARSASPELAASLLTVNTYALSDRNVRHYLSSRPEVVSALIAQRGESSERIVSTLVSAGLVTKDMVASLPWRAMRVRGTLSSSFAPRLATLLSEALGEDPAHWETFSVLAENFDGTIAELLELSTLT